MMNPKTTSFVLRKIIKRYSLKILNITDTIIVNIAIFDNGWIAPGQPLLQRTCRQHLLDNNFLQLQAIKSRIPLISVPSRNQVRIGTVDQNEKNRQHQDPPDNRRLFDYNFFLWHDN